MTEPIAQGQLDWTRPVVLSGYARELFPEWSLRWLLDSCAGAEVPVRINGEKVMMPFAEAVKAALNAALWRNASWDVSVPYITDWDFSGIKPLVGRWSRPSFARDDAILSIPAERRPMLVWIYFGGRGSGTPLHWDVMGAHAWSAVISGGKEWVFYPPETDFGPDAVNRNVFAPEEVDADQQLGRKRTTIVVSAGDVLFVPSKWWHQVRNLEPTLAVGGNFVREEIASTVYKECQQLGYRHITHQLEHLYGCNVSGV